MRSAPGRPAGEAGVLAVVRGEDHGVGGPALADDVGGRVAEGGERVAVDHGRHLGPGHQVMDGRLGRRRAPEPRPDDEGAGPFELLGHRRLPARGGHGDADRLGGQGRVVVDAGRRHPDHPRAGPQRGGRRQVGGPGHPGGAGGQHHGGTPLVGVGRPRRHPGGDVGLGDQPHDGHPGPADPTSSPMSATTTSPARPEPGGNSRPGLSAANVTVLDGGQRPARHGPGEAGHAAGDVDGQHGDVAGLGGVVGAAEPGAVGGVDHQVAAADVAGRVGGHHAHPHAPPGQDLGRHPPVVAVVALAGDHHHPPPVGAAQQVDGVVGHGGGRPADEGLDRLGRGGVDGRHLLGRQDGQHGH